MTTRRFKVSSLRIANARIHDGVNWIASCDVWIDGGRISLSPIAGAPRIYDAKGLVLSPGFIDVHNMSRGPWQMVDRPGANLLSQGVTSVVTGNCGMSGPFSDAEAIRDHIIQIQSGKWAVNVLPLLGHGSLVTALGSHPDVLAVLESALLAGIGGVSFGLMYEPELSLDPSRFEDVASLIGSFDGVLAIHMRSEGREAPDSVAEAAAFRDKCRVTLLHAKACGPSPHAGFASIRRLLAQNGAHPLIVTEYPYVSTNTHLRALASLDEGQDPTTLDIERIESVGLHRLARRGWEGVTLSSNVPDSLVGLSIAELARNDSRRPAQKYLELIAAFPQARALYHDVTELSMLWDLLDNEPHCIPASDGYISKRLDVDDSEHPRNFGAISSCVQRYSGSWELLGSVLRKVTSLPAAHYRIPSRGRIVDGYIADLTLIDPEQVRAVATYEQPRRLASGVVGVWLGGNLAWDGTSVLGSLGEGLRSANEGLEV